jgi:hypothetical protein
MSSNVSTRGTTRIARQADLIYRKIVLEIDGMDMSRNIICPFALRTSGGCGVSHHEAYISKGFSCTRTVRALHELVNDAGRLNIDVFSS